jgi:hypothetical protein
LTKVLRKVMEEEKERRKRGPWGRGGGGKAKGV